MSMRILHMGWCFSVIVFLGVYLSGGSPVQAMSIGEPPPAANAAGLSVVGLAAGLQHTCLLTTTGAVYCWGYNGFGQLGSGSSINFQPSPKPVSGLSSGVTQITAGAYHTCALLTTGTVMCWGYNLQGQIGVANPTPPAGPEYFTPVAIPSLTGVSAIAAGYDFTCAVVSGGVKCWGNNKWGTLGVPITTANSDTPVDVTGLGSGSGASSITAGFDHACALLSGAVQCWGTNSYGQLGNGTTDPPSSPVTMPVTVTGLSGATAIAAGSQHTCALVGNPGTVRCWGENTFGQLGTGNTTNQSSPQIISSLSNNVTEIFAGGDANNAHTCARLTDSRIQCWGANSFGQLGDHSNVNRDAPVTAVSSGASWVTLGVEHTCAIVNTRVQCWGSDSFGQLGDGLVSASLIPGDLVGIGSVTSLGIGERNTCAIAGGEALCWGDNRYGQMSDGTIVNRSLPAGISGLAGGAMAIDSGENLVCVVLGGGVKCWGENVSSPTDIIPPGGGVSGLSLGFRHACAIINEGVKCWGDNTTGELGDGTTSSSSSPVQVSGLTSGVTSVSTGGYSQGGQVFGHTCAVVMGGVKCWGNNNAGQLGNNSLVNSFTPVDVVGLSSGALSVAVGQDHSCALLSDKTVKCWGNNLQGQLGDGSSLSQGTNPKSLTPISVTGLPPASAITAGGYHTCALSTSSGVYCWGYNSVGQLGNNSVQHSSSPVPVNGLSTGVAAVYAGGINYDEEHTCVMLVNGTVRCWGGNEYGQLGDNLPIFRNSPVSVIGLSAQPEIGLNYTDGQPGSSFRLVGANFPVNTPVTIMVNGQGVGILQTNAQGYFVAQLSSAEAHQGNYSVSASGVTGSTLTLTINPSSPFRLREGNALTFGLSSTMIFLPVVEN